MDYTADSLRRGIEYYFASISRTVKATEEVKTSQKDKDGHWVYRRKVIKNDMGEPVVYREFIIPPSIADMRAYLGDMSKAEWNAYMQDNATGPVLRKAAERIEGYLAGQLLTRGKTRGVEFSLSHEFDWKDKKEISIGTGAVEKFLETAGGSSEF